MCPVAPAAPREVPRHSRERVLSRQGFFSQKWCLNYLGHTHSHAPIKEGATRLMAQSSWCCQGFPYCQLIVELGGGCYELSPHGRCQAQSLSIKSSLPTVPYPHSAFPGARGESTTAWQLCAGGLRCSPGEQEWGVQCAQRHWSLVQTYFKARGSQQGSYTPLLIFTSIQSTLSKSTQWDLYRVINRPQLSRLPLPCSVLFLSLPGYTWHLWILCLIFPLTTIHFSSF